MWIELAHYLVLFAMVAVGLQALILSPTLWSKGSAVAIKLGFRGACFATFLLFLAFFVLLYAFASYDFSLAIVFERFSTQVSVLNVLDAFCSAREGVFFLFILIISVVGLLHFQNIDLATYQERGRYLFGMSAFLFCLIILMVVTANPFIRIDEPALEGLVDEIPPTVFWQTIELISTLTAYAFLTVTCIKMISMYSKGWHFALPAFLTSLSALFFVILSFIIKGFLHTALPESTALWTWTPANCLSLSIALLLIGQVLILYLCQTARIFSSWALLFSLIGMMLLFFDFFGFQYGLFALKKEEAYFPNPVIAVSAIVGLLCLLLFFCSSLAQKLLKEDSFSFFSQESFVGLSATSFLSLGVCLGVISFVPVLFLFQTNLPFQIKPDLFKSMIFFHACAVGTFLSVGLHRLPIVKGWIKINKKQTLWIFLVSCCFVLIYFVQKNSHLDVFLWSVPFLCIFISMIHCLELTDKMRFIYQFTKASIGFLSIGLGALIFIFTFAINSFEQNPSVIGSGIGLCLIEVGILMILFASKRRKIV